MKDKSTLKLFCLRLLFSYIYTSETYKPKEIFQHYFYLQKLYPGTDSMASLKTFKQGMNLYFFTLNAKLLFYTKNAKEKKIGGNNYIIV